jgi:hypothetical protein
MANTNAAGYPQFGGKNLERIKPQRSRSGDPEDPSDDGYRPWATKTVPVSDTAAESPTDSKPSSDSSDGDEDEEESETANEEESGSDDEGGSNSRAEDQCGVKEEDDEDGARGTFEASAYCFSLADYSQPARPRKTLSPKSV